MGDDDGAGIAEGLVAAGMVAVPVGVDQKFHRRIGQLADGRHDLAAERSELIVNEESAVLAYRNAEIPAGSNHHVDTRRDFGCLYLHLRKVVLRPDDRRHDSRHNSNSDSSHGIVSLGALFGRVCRRHVLIHSNPSQRFPQGVESRLLNLVTSSVCEPSHWVCPYTATSANGITACGAAGVGEEKLS